MEIEELKETIKGINGEIDKLRGEQERWTQIHQKWVESLERQKKKLKGISLKYPGAAYEMASKAQEQWKKFADELNKIDDQIELAKKSQQKYLNELLPELRKRYEEEVERLRKTGQLSKYEWPTFDPKLYLNRRERAKYSELKKAVAELQKQKNHIKRELRKLSCLMGNLEEAGVVKGIPGKSIISSSKKIAKEAIEESVEQAFKQAAKRPSLWRRMSNLLRGLFRFFKPEIGIELSEGTRSTLSITSAWRVALKSCSPSQRRRWLQEIESTWSDRWGLSRPPDEQTASDQLRRFKKECPEGYNKLIHYPHESITELYRSLYGESFEDWRFLEPNTKQD